MRLLFVEALETHWAHGFYVSIWNFTVPSFGKIFISSCHFAIFSIFPSFLIFFYFPLFLHLFTFSILQIIFIHKIFNSDYFLLFLIWILLSNPPFFIFYFIFTRSILCMERLYKSRCVSVCVCVCVRLFLSSLIWEVWWLKLF